MTLLRAVQYARHTREPPLLSSYGARIDATGWFGEHGDAAARVAIIAANINIVRRDAPYAYLFANTFSRETWREETEDMAYLRSLDTIELRRGVSLSDPEWKGTTSTVVTAILQGDVIEVVHFLDQEEFTLLCLPFYRSLTRLDETVASAASNLDAVRALLADGGCSVSNVDDVDFRVITLDSRFARHFQPDQ